MQKKVTLSFDEETYQNFQRYCDENALKLSGKLELVMKDILKNSNSDIKAAKKREK